MRNERDQYAIRMTAINEGREEGIAIGEARGEAKVLDLMAQGYDYGQIKDILKLS